MGLFKKLKKLISFKNLIKGVTAGISIIPMGGLAGRIITKATTLIGRHKEAAGLFKSLAHKAMQKGNAEEAKANMEASEYHDAQADAHEAMNKAGGDPNFGQILGGAMEGAGGVLAHDSNATHQGAAFMNGSIITWVKEHWVWLVVGVASVWLAMKFIFKPRTAKRRY